MDEQLSWWQRIVQNKRAIAGTVGAALLFICPLMPPQARGPCELARAGVHLAQQVMNGDELQRKPDCEPETKCSSTSRCAPYDDRLPDGGVCNCPALGPCPSL